MGVDVPVDAVNSILKAQLEWEKSIVKRSSKEASPEVCCSMSSFKSSTWRHWGVGNIVGEYVGEVESESMKEVVVDMSTDSGVDLSMELTEDSSDDAKPLLFFYDCETTGLSIYNDHIIEIAAQLVDCPVPYSNTTFSTLIKTSRRLPTAGMK